MRRIEKYKIYTKIKDIYRYPIRILKFKRPKWDITKKNMVTAKPVVIDTPLVNPLAPVDPDAAPIDPEAAASCFYSDNDIVKVTSESWPTMKDTHSDSVINQRSLLIQYNNDKRILKYLKAASKKAFVSDSIKKFFRLYYRLDSLLFLGDLSPSTFFSKDALKGKKILLNGLVTKRATFLKKGDFVLIKDQSFNYEILSKRYTELNLYPTFIEVDYYTQSLVLLKNLDETTTEDFSISIGKHLDLKSC